MAMAASLDSKGSRWELVAEKWGISDLWDLAALFNDLRLTFEDGKGSPATLDTAPSKIVDMLQLQEAELRANEALQKRLETQVAILKDDISRMRHDLHRAPKNLPFGGC